MGIFVMSLPATVSAASTPDVPAQPLAQLPLVEVIGQRLAGQSDNVQIV
jgi:hypothetical protein